MSRRITLGRAVSTPRRHGADDSFKALCCGCGGPSYADGGVSYLCFRCQVPLIRKGQDFKPSINVRRF